VTMTRPITTTIYIYTKLANPQQARKGNSEVQRSAVAKHRDRNDRVPIKRMAKQDARKTEINVRKV
jgi:hypothetical protein